MSQFRKMRLVASLVMPLVIAAVWVVGAMMLTHAEPVGAEEVVVTCRAETISDDGGFNVSDQAGCTVPAGVSVTRAVLHAILDDGGTVYINGDSVLSINNDPGVDDITQGVGAPSGNFTLRVDAVNAIDGEGRGLGPVYGMAELIVYGNVTPPPTHLECRNNACVRVDGAGGDQCSSNAQCAPPAPTHLECRNNACVRVDGAGNDQCSSNAQCTPPATHLECRNNACVSVAGAGSNQCSSDAQCAPQTHLECRNNACVSVAGAGANQCTTNAQCTPPPTPVTCSPSSQTANVNQTVNFSASGGSGSFTWVGGGNPVSGSGSSFSTSFSSGGSYAVTVSSGGSSAICAVTVNQVNAPTVTISANPSAIQQGQTSVLTWSSQNATTCTASGGWSGGKGLSGSETVQPAQTTTYTITCSNASGQTATASATVNVTQVGSLTCSPGSQNANVNQTVNFSASGGTGTYSWSGGGNPGTGTGGTFSTSYGGNGTYTVTVTSGSATATCSVNVATVVSFPTVTLTANPSSIQQGQTSVLTWSSQNTTSCTVSGGWSGTRGTSGSETVSPSQTTTYFITCLGTNGSQVNANATVYVNTVSQVPSVTLNANPSFVQRGQPSTLTWSSQNATQCYATGGWSGNVPTNGSQTVYPQFTTTYTINCTNGTNFAQDSRTVVVGDQCFGGSCNPCQYGTGGFNCPANNLQVTKTALNRTLNQTGYGSTIEAQGLDVIEFEIRVRNLDQGYGTVTVRDTLPQELFYVPNSTTIDGAPAPDGITTSGLQVGQIGSQQERVVRFRAVVFSGISNRTVTNQVSATMNQGVQNAYATITIRQRGQVLGAADIVTGPDDALPWVMLVGLVGSLISYLGIFKFRWIELSPALATASGPMSELERIVLEIRKEEGRPDTV